METAYVYLQNEVIGSAQIDRCGLYTRFRCVCKLPEGSMYRIWITGIRQPMELGILIPENGKFTVDKQIAAKHLGKEELRLEALPIDQRSAIKFVPIQLDEQFMWLDRLGSARFGRVNGNPGIYLE